MNDGIDITRLNLNGLVEYHNTINPDNPVKSFRTKPIAIDRINAILNPDEPVNISDYKKDQKMEDQVLPEATAEVAPENIGEVEVPPVADDVKKPKAKKEPVDATDQETKLDQVTNRKDIAIWHAHNDAGVVARWDAAADLWAEADESRAEEDAPGLADRNFIVHFGSTDIKGWPKLGDLKAALKNVEQSINLMSNE